ncbi:hypothetical protein [Niabella hibiscisoli]|uniref:hypothetical protein n=1 Tax=Niabella hibiscisoli TaxID=1825928 RepID=UPI001F0D1F3B|nr:hypothetical protein [Niabella hibiscisoli]MCH5718724.1 hypothetical protein [Niabella hibiscisoli]
MYENQESILAKNRYGFCEHSFLSTDLFHLNFNQELREDGVVLRVALMGLGGYASRVAESIQNCRRVKITALVSGTPKSFKPGAKNTIYRKVVATTTRISTISDQIKQ